MKIKSKGINNRLLKEWRRLNSKQHNTDRKQRATEDKGWRFDAALLSTTDTDDRAPRIPSTGRSRGNGDLFK